MRRVEPFPEQILGEIGGGGDADERMDSLGSGQRRQQHDPAAHARPDQDLRAFGQFVDDGDRILDPAADRADGEVTARRPVAKIIEAHKGAAAPPAVFLEKERLGAGHVRPKSAQEHDPGGLAGEPVVGDCCTVVTW